MKNIEEYGVNAIDYIVKALPNFLMAIAALIIGLWLIKKLTNILSLSLQKSGFSIEIINFLSTLANIGLKIMLMISVAGMVGINTAAFVGVLAATGLAVGLALQGSLGNFAAGIIIVTFKPYKVGDWVEVKDKFGKVSDIHIFNTQMITPGNKTLVIPNGEVINGVITNYSKLGNIRLEMKVLLPYSEDFPRVRTLILQKLMTNPKILKEPIPEVGIDSFQSHYLEIAVRPYVVPDDYWEVYYDVMSMVKTLYHDNNIPIAYSEGVEMGQIGK